MTAILLIVFALLFLRLLPKPPLRDFAQYSSAVYAEDGTLLRLTTASDEQYRLWTPLEAISPKVAEAVMRYEDRWFYWHPGVNPAAMVRSAYATFTGERRQGGSTLTMQLARKRYGIDSRTMGGKLQQMAAACWLEARYSKHDILEAYLNFAPYGGNIEGVGAASLVYFQKRAVDLTLPEAFTLAVIPQNPAARGGSKVTSAATVDARARIAALWLAKHPEDERLGASHAIAPKFAAALPFRAPHVVTQLLKDRQGEVFSSIDLKMQNTVERAIAQRIEQYRDSGMHNASAILLDTETMQVKALVGSANFNDDEIDGQVNGVLAKRSPGSTLKPFIYALAFDQGVLHPMTVLKDAPTAFGPFSPENFDGRFVGPITAQEALTRSRNIPAVSVAAKLTRPSLYDLMKTSGVANLASEKHYGLALTLGGGEVTMEELARMYAMLANGGELKPIAYSKNATPLETKPFSRSREKLADRPDEGTLTNTRLLSEEAAYVTLDMLKTNPRPDTGLPAQPAVAWKTGTSWGFRDAWTAGTFGRYVLIVWVGNFDGSSNQSFIGISAAAPLFFNIVDGLRNEGLLAQETNPRLPPRKLTRVEVCAATGDLPNAYCPTRVPSWFMPGKSPIRVSNLHRRVLLDRRTGQAVCEEGPNTHWQVIEYWPSDMQKIFRDAGMPRREAPRLPDCARGSADNNIAGDPQIVSPLRAVTYTSRLSNMAPISLRAEGNSGGNRGKLFWFSNDAFVGEAQAGEALAWNPPRAGRYVVRVVDEAGRADSRDVSVEVVP
ncbi:MAG: penicillin-binding protein 1C [Burkholderiales bacterium]|nr:penicillin-binding protein 1C [Burkholderiales bacterium]